MQRRPTLLCNTREPRPQFAPCRSAYAANKRAISMMQRLKADVEFDTEKRQSATPFLLKVGPFHLSAALQISQRRGRELAAFRCISATRSSDALQ